MDFFSKGGRNKPSLTCVDDDRITICAEGIRVGGEVEIEVEFDSDPEPSKVVFFTAFNIQKQS